MLGREPRRSRVVRLLSAQGRITAGVMPKRPSGSPMCPRAWISERCPTAVAQLRPNGSSDRACTSAAQPTEDKDRALEELRSAFHARSAQRSVQSTLQTWVDFHKAWFGSVNALPLTRERLREFPRWQSVGATDRGQTI